MHWRCFPSTGHAAVFFCLRRDQSRRSNSYAGKMDQTHCGEWSVKLKSQRCATALQWKFWFVFSKVDQIYSLWQIACICSAYLKQEYISQVSTFLEILPRQVLCQRSVLETTDHMSYIRSSSRLCCARNSKFSGLKYKVATICVSWGNDIMLHDTTETDNVECSTSHHYHSMRLRTTVSLI